jgi:hypothetical protein
MAKSKEVTDTVEPEPETDGWATPVSQEPEPEPLKEGLTTSPPVVTALTALGTAQETFVTGSLPATVTFTPTGNLNFLTLKTAGAWGVTVTAVCKVACSMPLACANAAGTNDAGLHNFVMNVLQADVEKSFVIPYLDHYIDPDPNSATYGMITLNCDANMQAHGSMGIFTVP